jgi:hypothetical protein
MGVEFSAGAPSTCEDCGATMMLGLTEAGTPIVVHVLPVCAGFTHKALAEARRSVDRIIAELPPLRPPSREPRHHD